MVKPNAYDWEVIGWKEERAGRLEEALQAYNNALMLDPRNEIICAKRDFLIERLKSPDPFYFPPPEDLDQG
jgi:predicted TPR repeat methyltransferase